MQPLIVTQEVRRGVADFLATAFPSTTAGFRNLITSFLAEESNLFKGPYLTVSLPFRSGSVGGAHFSWLPEGFRRRRCIWCAWPWIFVWRAVRKRRANIWSFMTRFPAVRVT
jgi:hypothetical protein